MKVESGFWDQYRDEAESATYDPSDDEIRIYTGYVPRSMYLALRDAGFGRAPVQGCFFQVWTPEREDVALALCDEIETEGTTLAERAEDRYIRFAGYRDNAASRAHEQAERSRQAIEGIPFGQPILVGHHSERKHRKAIEKAQRAASKTVEEFDRRDYWKWRAQGVIRNAAHKFAPGTTYRRIKSLRTELRKMKRDRKRTPESFRSFVWWWVAERREDEDGQFVLENHRHMRFADLSREDQLELRTEYIENVLERRPWYDRWIDHLEGQIFYWESIYEVVRTDGLEGSTNEQREIRKGDWIRNRRWGGWARVVRVNKSRETGLISTVSVDMNTYTQRFCIRKWDYENIAQVLSEKQYQQLTETEKLGRENCGPRAQKAVDEEKEEAKELVDKVEQVETVVTYDNDYHPTPGDVAGRMVDLLNVPDLLARFGLFSQFLEPSSGDGRLIRWLQEQWPGLKVDFCELNATGQRLSEKAGGKLVCADFLEYEPRELYSGIVMNPPYSKRAWIAHLKKAMHVLAVGGRLVALLPTGALYQIEHYLDLLDAEQIDLGSVFEGTQIETSIVVIEKEG